jgi:hypothetical protein
MAVDSHGDYSKARNRTIGLQICHYVPFRNTGNATRKLTTETIHIGNMKHSLILEGERTLGR